MKKIITIVGIMALAVFLISFVANEEGNKKTNQADSTVHAEDKIQSEVVNETPTNNPEIYLTAGGNSNPEEYYSNFYLHMAHLGIGALTYNATFNNGGDPLNEEIFKDSLNA